MPGKDTPVILQHRFVGLAKQNPELESVIGDFAKRLRSCVEVAEALGDSPIKCCLLEQLEKLRRQTLIASLNLVRLNALQRL